MTVTVLHQSQPCPRSNDLFPWGFINKQENCSRTDAVIFMLFSLINTQSSWSTMGNFERRLKWSGWSKSTHVFLLKVVINWRNMSSIQGSKQAEHVSEIIFQFCFVLTQWFDKINCSLISCSDGRHFGKMAAQISTATKARRSKEKAPQKCSISTIYVQC